MVGMPTASTRGRGAQLASLAAAACLKGAVTAADFRRCANSCCAAPGVRGQDRALSNTGGFIRRVQSLSTP